MSEPSAVAIRTYRPGLDAAGTYACFRAAIIGTASADYDRTQITAWAGPADGNLEAWDARRSAAHTFVADAAGTIAGFADLRDDAVLDMLFVRPEFGGLGLAGRLVDTVKRAALAAGLKSLTTHASRTARPAFERFGFVVVAEQPDTTVRGVIVPNYRMRWDELSD
ncbi:acetyltransferase [Microlunatus endophyticus]|uniref:Acetyltransferase n=1 Tax=Microlunatus endophyticus TaxID=1716077 RepID=A0A917SGN2_9ACTN|nr:GNAT family N-acetyltransferase [Microlunatus endophyticus]GGL78858.1 acetyltransferase [Microlunatus endophyticus]